MRGVGRAIFAATLLILAGTVNIIYGIGALGDANIFQGGQRFVFTNLNAMGWILIVLGLFELFGGFSLDQRQRVRSRRRDRRSLPRRDRRAVLDQRTEPVVVAGGVLPVHLRDPRGLHLRDRAGRREP